MLKKNVVSIVMLVSITLLINACSTLKVKTGRNVDITLLESSLNVGASNRENVIAVLGVPHGKGRAMLPIDDAPRTLWSYFYEEDTISLTGDESISNIQMLLIYFKGNIYDGYMGFATYTK